MLYINGEWRDASGGATFEVTDPATGKVLNHVADGSRADAAEAIGAAEAAFAGWSTLTAYQRSEKLYAAHQLMVERREDLAKLMTSEQGKPLRAARNEVGYAADFLLWFAEEAKRVYGQTIPSSRADQRFMVLRQPVGVCAAITPWNYPVSMLTRKIGPALAAGCTIVLKPAEQTPLCAIEVVKIFDEVGLPPGVVNLLPTSDPVPVGTEFMANPSVRKLTFTGSTEVGKLLMSQAAPTMKRISMELGGHAPFIVYDDADPARAAVGAAMVKVLNTGQACICPNRLYVQRGIAQEFTDTLAGRIGRMQAGSGFTEGVQIGPLVDEASLAKVDRQVRDAVAKGATVVTGGARLSEGELANGNFYAPTVLTGVTPEMVIYREETFGPVAPIIVFDDEDEVLAMANDTSYGLASYVYTNDLGRAFRTVERLRFGIVGVNDINPTAAAAPFGGVKESGLGREGGQEGILEYLDTKLVGFAL
ncbi:MAG: succinate-semialdehyde dehydrogenase / glutarate-semialdehyde dehydrogenase [Acidimicrobiia bacterium]|nr:succinate-semialdehyde dehydrogenase / glutarate-semialdehyde dehydrogenase [Acidimicrobiia bacterium]